MSSEHEADGFYAALLDDDPAALYERAPCGYLSTAPDGTIVKVNATFEALSGYERGDLVGRRTFAQLLSAGGRIYHETHYAPMLQMQGSAREIALEIVRPDGSRVPVLVNSVLDRADDGAPVVIRTAVFDATARRRYELELLRAKERAEESEARARALATTLQQTLIPPELPEIAGLDIAAAYRPAGAGDEVGGDFYDVFQLGPRSWLVAIGDVRGKGVEAAVVTALARYTIRAAAMRHDDLRPILETLNDVLLRNDTDRFCTVALLRLRHDGTGWRAAVCHGGHPLALLQRRGARPTTIGAPGSLLGVVQEPGFDESEHPLGPGDVVIVYTDGVTEGRRGDEFFEEDRLAAVVEAHASSARSVTDTILEAVLDFQSGNARDDIAVVAVRVPDPE